MEESIPLARFKEDVSESSVGHELSEGFMYWTKRERYYGLHKMRLWGYFVEAELQAKKKDKEGQANKSEEDTKFVKPHLLRILWVGRLLYWKRVDGLIRTVVRLLEEGQDVSLQIVGMGTEEIRLKKIAGVWLLEQPGRVRGISFSTPVRISEVRHLMRESDVFVLPSNGYEGWGAVVNEAMTEGCAVIASRQSGAGATLINDSKNGILFNAGDWRGLHKALSMFIENPSYMQIVADQGKYTIRNFWSPESGAKRLLDFCNSL
jgi:glycosyltransferase involved in cell wall biosynthesis